MGLILPQVKSVQIYPVVQKVRAGLRAAEHQIFNVGSPAEPVQAEQTSGRKTAALTSGTFPSGITAR